MDHVSEIYSDYLIDCIIQPIGCKINKLGCACVCDKNETSRHGDFLNV